MTIPIPTFNWPRVVQNGKLTIVPAQQIASIEIKPAPKLLIAHVIKDIEPVKEIQANSSVTRIPPDAGKPFREESVRT
jgi:hypothetical protein